MRAYFAGSSVPTPEEMGKMVASSPELTAAHKLVGMPVADKKPVKKKSVRARKSLLPKPITDKLAIARPAAAE